MQYQIDKTEILSDYKIANVSRQLSILARKEVLNGKAKFGIFGDGKEIAQIALAKFFRNGDFRSGYYRDQTFMLAAGMLSPVEFFSQVYGDTNLNNNPANAGRLMNNHYGSRSIDESGQWKNLTAQKNSSSDISPTAGQMPRLVGLALASKLFRKNEHLKQFTGFSDNGNEVAFGTIGDSSTSEGHFFEAFNAAGVMQIPMIIAVWDDGYGISVPQEYQTTKQSISEILKGFENDSDKNNGYSIFKAEGWNYLALIDIFEKGIAIARTNHNPVLFHITQMTQPLGHSTSGSHERYKTPERLNWEKEFDPIKKFKEWILEKHLATEDELNVIEQQSITIVAEAKQTAWEMFTKPILDERKLLIELIESQKTCMCKQSKVDKITAYKNELNKILFPIRKDNFSMVKKILRHVCIDCPQRKPLQKVLSEWLKNKYLENFDRYSSHLYSQSEFSPLKIEPVLPQYNNGFDMVTGREILRDNFDALFAKYPLLVAFGEDVGRLGGVNQTYEGLQEKYSENRIFDTGIRETTIIGQAIGLALRGFRPIAEIQYFDYLLYALQTLSDDLATCLYRTKAGQKAPVIVSTRGHRLEGIWHSGSPLSMVINSIRGMYICVPRNMTQAAGFYNTLMASDNPALIIEPLNGYRLKEKRPSNMGNFYVPLGIPEIITEGTDITIVTYGSCVRIAEQAILQLKEFNISCELIDVQTLIPFDLNGIIKNSITKTNKVLFFDEDVPGGATAYMMQKVVEEQEAFNYLDMPPRTLTAREHRPAYSTDGDYFSNPNAEDVFEIVYQIMNRYNPVKHPAIY